MEKIYNVFVKMGESLQEVEADLVADYGSDTIPERSVEVADPLEWTPQWTQFYLTDDEAEQVKKDPRVHNVTIPMDPKPILIGSGSQKGEMARFTKYPDDDFEYNIFYNDEIEERGTENVFSKAPLINWGLGRHKSFKDDHLKQRKAYGRGRYYRNPDDEDDNTNYRNFYTTGHYGNEREWEYDGEGVDIIILDTGVNAESPEWLDENGNSRFVKYDWAYKITNYDEPADFYRDYHGHGTHVASTAAGKLHGWAKKANIYAIPCLEHPNAVDPVKAVLAVYQFCREKGQNGNTRPTVVNMSFGFGAYLNYITNVHHKGQDHNVGDLTYREEHDDWLYSQNMSDLELSTSYGLHRGANNYHFSSYEYPEMEMAMAILMDSAFYYWDDVRPHVCVAAGNDYNKLDVNPHWLDDALAQDDHTIPSHDMLSDHFGQQNAGLDWDNYVEARYAYNYTDLDPIPDGETRKFYYHRPSQPFHPRCHLVGAIGAEKSNGHSWANVQAFGKYFEPDAMFVDSSGTKGKFETKAWFSNHGPAVNTWAAGENILAAISMDTILEEKGSYSIQTAGTWDDTQLYKKYYFGMPTQINSRMIKPPEAGCGFKLEFDTTSVAGKLRMYAKLTPEAIQAALRHDQFNSYTGLRNVKIFLQWDSNKGGNLSNLGVNLGFGASESLVGYDDATAGLRSNIADYVAVSYDAEHRPYDEGNYYINYNSEHGYNPPARNMYDLDGNVIEWTAPTAMMYHFEAKPNQSSERDCCWLMTDFNQGRDLQTFDQNWHGDWSQVQTVIPHASDAGIEDRIFFEISLPLSDLPDEYNPDHADYNPNSNLHDLFAITASTINFYERVELLRQATDGVDPDHEDTQHEEWGRPWHRDYENDGNANEYALLFGSANSSFSGTSMASPQVAGMIACTLEKQNMGTTEMLEYNTARSASTRTRPAYPESANVGMSKDEIRLSDVFYGEDGNIVNRNTNTDESMWGNYYGRPQDSLYGHSMTSFSHYYHIIGPRNVVVPPEVARENETTITGGIHFNSGEYGKNSVLGITYDTPPAVAGYLAPDETVNIQMTVNGKDYSEVHSNGIVGSGAVAFGRNEANYIPPEKTVDADWASKGINSELGALTVTKVGDNTYQGQFTHTNPHPTDLQELQFNGSILGTELAPYNVTLLPQEPKITNRPYDNLLEITLSEMGNSTDLASFQGVQQEYNPTVVEIGVNMPWDLLTLSFVEEGDDWDKFEIQSNHIVKYKTPPFDYEDQNYFEFKLVVTDNFGRVSDPLTVKLTITDVDETAPLIQFVEGNADVYSTSVFTSALPDWNTSKNPIYAHIDEHDLTEKHIGTIRARDPRGIPLDRLHILPFPQVHPDSSVYYVADTQGYSDQFQATDGSVESFINTPFRVEYGTYTDENGDDWDTLDLYCTNIDYEYGLDNLTDHPNNIELTYTNPDGGQFYIHGSFDHNNITFNHNAFNVYAKAEGASAVVRPLGILVQDTNIEPNINTFDDLKLITPDGRDSWGVTDVEAYYIDIDYDIKAGDVVHTLQVSPNNTHPVHQPFIFTNLYRPVNFLRVYPHNADDPTQFGWGPNVVVDEIYEPYDENAEPYFEVNQAGEIIALRDISHEDAPYVMATGTYGSRFAPAGWWQSYDYRNYFAVGFNILDVDRTPHFVDDNGDTITQLNLDILEHQDVDTVLATLQTMYPADWSLTFNTHYGSTSSWDTDDPNGHLLKLEDANGSGLLTDVTSCNLLTATKWFPDYEGDILQDDGSFAPVNWSLNITATNDDGTAQLVIMPTVQDNPDVDDNITINVAQSMPTTVNHEDISNYEALYQVTFNRGYGEVSQLPYLMADDPQYGTDSSIYGLTIDHNMGQTYIRASSDFENFTGDRIKGWVVVRDSETSQRAAAMIDITVNHTPASTSDNLNNTFIYYPTIYDYGSGASHEDMTPTWRTMGIEFDNGEAITGHLIVGHQITAQPYYYENDFAIAGLQILDENGSIHQIWDPRYPNGNGYVIPALSTTTAQGLLNSETPQYVMDNYNWADMGSVIPQGTAASYARWHSGYSTSSSNTGPANGVYFYNYTYPINLSFPTLGQYVTQPFFFHEASGSNRSWQKTYMRNKAPLTIPAKGEIRLIYFNSGRGINQDQSLFVGFADQAT